MSGRGRLRIPRNAWVRSVDFNTEVQGEVEITKEAEAPFLFFGGLDAIRGQYIFQNARFSIDRGELRFRGTPDNDPDLYLLGTRRIPRALPDAGGNPSQDLLIHIVVGGTLTKSKVTLESDAPTPLDQADLLSYLLFGRPSSQTLLGSLGGGGSTANLQSQAQNLAFGIAANHLKQTVGRELGLDVLEVEVGQGKETFTHLAVGKYVRRDLLLTFSQDVVQAVGQGQDRLGRKVSVEYELGRSFGVSGSVDDQGKTALDLFWKKEW
jgi:translocation and assembly module TamB